MKFRYSDSGDDENDDGVERADTDNRSDGDSTAELTVATQIELADHPADDDLEAGGSLGKQKL